MCFSKLKLLSLWFFISFSYGATEDQVPLASTRLTPFPDLYEASILELQSGLEQGHFTSVDLVKVSWQYHLNYGSSIISAEYECVHDRHILRALKK